MNRYMMAAMLALLAIGACDRRAPKPVVPPVAEGAPSQASAEEEAPGQTPLSRFRRPTVNLLQRTVRRSVVLRRPISPISMSRSAGADRQPGYPCHA